MQWVWGQVIALDDLVDSVLVRAVHDREEERRADVTVPFSLDHPLDHGEILKEHKVGVPAFAVPEQVRLSIPSWFWANSRSKPSEAATSRPL